MSVADRGRYSNAALRRSLVEDSDEALGRKIDCNLPKLSVS